MVDGTYDVQLETPMGDKRGALLLRRAGDSVTGSLSAMGKRVALQDGTARDGDAGVELFFKGTLSVLFQRIPYACGAMLSPDGTLDGTVSTEFGDFKLTGARRA